MNGDAGPIPAPRRAGVRRYAPVVLPTFAGIVLSVLLFAVVRGWDETRIRSEFSRAAESRVAAVKESIEANLLEVEALGSLFTASNKVEWAEFCGFATPFLKKHPDIQALEWIPRVTDDQRARYEAAARADGFSGFRITERQAQGVMVAAARRPEYFPVHYLEPCEGNEVALGFDLASDAVRREAIERSRDSGRMLATARIPLVQETGVQFGVLVFLPVYRQYAPTTTVAERQRNLQGFALGVFRVGDMLRKSLARTRPEGVDIYLFDNSAPAADRLLAFSPSRTRKTQAHAITERQAYQRRGLHYSATIPVGDRRWWVLCTPTEEYLAARRSWQPWGALLSGLLLTASISAYLSLVLRSAERARQSAADLLQAKRGLERDAIERKRADAALWESREKLRAIVDNVGIGIALTSKRMEVLEMNQQMRRWFPKIDPGAHPICYCAYCDPPREAPCDWCPVVKTFADGQIHEATTETPAGDTIRNYRLVSTPLRDSAGEVVAAIEMVEDITERKRIEGALRASEERYRHLFERLNDAVFIADPDTGRLLEANTAASRLMGYSREELIGMHQSQLHPPGQAESYRDRFRRHIAAGIATDYDAEIVRKDGAVVPVRISAALAEIAGQRVNQGIFSDITERKRIEQALEAKNRELETFVYTVSHDLRAPLISMEGFARLLADEHADELDAEGCDYLRRVCSNVEAMDAMLHDLLELSRVGRVEERQENVPVAEVIAEVLDDLAGTIRESGAQITVADDMPSVAYSRARLTQVFSNLISNAIKFSREGVTPQIDVCCDERGPQCCFFVSDNGIGIEPVHQQDKIFEIFSRLQQKKVEGTGVGLAIVKRIVEEHGGRIGVESVPGQGSTFWFTIPRQT